MELLMLLLCAAPFLLTAWLMSLKAQKMGERRNDDFIANVIVYSIAIGVCVISIFLGTNWGR